MTLLGQSLLAVQRHPDPTSEHTPEKNCSGFVPAALPAAFRTFEPSDLFRI